MPKVPYAQSPSGQVTPMVPPVFMAMAAAEFVAEAKAQPKPKAPADAPTNRG